MILLKKENKGKKTKKEGSFPTPNDANASLLICKANDKKATQQIVTVLDSLGVTFSTSKLPGGDVGFAFKSNTSLTQKIRNTRFLPGISFKEDEEVNPNLLQKEENEDLLVQVLQKLDDIEELAVELREFDDKLTEILSILDTNFPSV